MKGKSVSLYNRVKLHSALALTALMLSPGFAFASGGGSDFDSSAVLAKIAANVLIGVGIIGAFILGLWTLRTMGLLKPKG